MSLQNWRVLDFEGLFGRVQDGASMPEQLEAIEEMVTMIRGESLHRIVLDLDHADIDLGQRVVQIQPQALAEGMVKAGLSRFALVHRGEVEVWWSDLLKSTRQLGIDTCAFTAADAAIEWICADGEDSLSQSG
ncbi:MULTISPECIES: hypothetical protein [Marinicauda]|jgi:hypothetical protein|uniref:STAS/SEC14 domain-containing protein n=1 Tax=Marinicauda pacifica TaxID=1133559 RepID=A0A4S2H8I1_9PROT|nr:MULTISPECIES: hypothetical protein [Marinicauda]TGY91848.1 hypothetical protein E5162_13315 [Marinicauda pacifica]